MSKTLSRRSFAKKVGGAGTAAAAASALPALQTAQAQGRAIPEFYRFPDGFKWGCATASYQIEGGAREGGRGPSIWDTFSHIPGKVYKNQTGDVADDDYHRYKEDVQMLKWLGAKVYRFSVAWPRSFPEGTGKPNQAGIDFYSQLTDKLPANGVEPFCTLFHWDLPQPCQDRVGGWESRDTAKAFGEYAGYVA